MIDPAQLPGIQVPKNPEIDSRHFQIEVPEGQDSFSDMLKKAVNGVDSSMKGAEQNMQNYVAGKTDNVADVMISMQRSQLSFQMMVEVRNKAIEAYQELSRMQI